MRYTIPVQRGFMFEEALRMINELRKVNIDSNITVGGLAVYPENQSKVNILHSICTNFGVEYDKGFSMKEEDAIYRVKK